MDTDLSGGGPPAPVGPEEQPTTHVPWAIVLEHIWPCLRSSERHSVAGVCKDAWTFVRSHLQTTCSLYASQKLNEYLLLHSRGGLKARYPFANRLVLKFDPEHMDDVDGPSSGPYEDRTRTAATVLAVLGRHEGIKSCRLDGWEYLPQSAVFAMLSSLPSLACLELAGAYRVDLDALLVPAVTQLTALQAHADHILMAPDVLRSAPVLTQLQELRLTGLQVNDQPADNELCAALGALTGLTQLELVTFSAATRPGMVALRGIHNETLRGHPLKALGPSLAGLTRLRSLLVSDPHLELRTANAILGCMAGLAQLEDLVMPEARVREEGWRVLQQLTSLVRVHLYSIELKGQAKASAPGSITWWRRLRLEDTCLPELASFMPVPGLSCFIATLFMRYGEGPVPAREFKGLDAVLACLGNVEEVRLWLELDCDIWPGLSRILGQLRGLQEVVVRARHPHPLDARDLSCLAAAAARLRFLDISQSDIGDEGLRPLEGLTELTKVCLGQAQRENQEGHTPLAVQRLAVVLAARRRPALLVAPHLLDSEVEELEEWQEQEPHVHGAVTVADTLPPDVLMAAHLSYNLHAASGADGGREGAGGGAGAGGQHRASVVAQSFAGGSGAGSAAAAGGYPGVGTSSGSGVVRWSLVEPDDALVVITNDSNEYFRRVDL